MVAEVPMEEAAPVASVAPVSEPIQAAQSQNAFLRAGTPITLRLLEEVTTKEKAARVGQRIRMEVAAPVVVNSMTVIPAGSLAEGEITSVRNKGMWGKRAANWSSVEALGMSANNGPYWR